MAMLGIHFTGKVPFRAVYLHSLVRTGSGEKMSKSKGTGLDPVVLNQQYGTDAMRFCLASMAAPGTDIILSDDRLAGARNFANKIWNAARFLFMNLSKIEGSNISLETVASPEIREKDHLWRIPEELPLVHRWIYSRLARAISSVDHSLQNYRFHEAANAVYQFFWGDFCDWYVEWVKPELADESSDLRFAWYNMFSVFDAALRLLHPFMPFLTEELWHQLPRRSEDKSISLQSFPTVRADWIDLVAEGQFACLQNVLGAIRNIRAELKSDPKKRLGATFSSSDAGIRTLIQGNRTGIIRLGFLSDLVVTAEPLPNAGGVVRSTSQFDVRVAYSDVVDVQAEKTRIKKEIEGLQKAISSKEGQLGNETFRSRAPEKIIRGLEETLATQRIELKKLVDRLGQL